MCAVISFVVFIHCLYLINVFISVCYFSPKIRKWKALEFLAVLMVFLFFFFWLVWMEGMCGETPALKFRPNICSLFLFLSLFPCCLFCSASLGSCLSFPLIQFSLIITELNIRIVSHELKSKSVIQQDMTKYSISRVETPEIRIDWTLILILGMLVVMNLPARIMTS